MNTNHPMLIDIFLFRLTVSPGKSIFDAESACQQVIFSGTSLCLYYSSSLLIYMHQVVDSQTTLPPLTTKRQPLLTTWRITPSPITRVCITPPAPLEGSQIFQLTEPTTSFLWVSQLRYVALILTGLSLQVNGKFLLVYGTSASSPVVGAILTLVNDARLAVNKSPIGFINPTVSVYIICTSDCCLIVAYRSIPTHSLVLSMISLMELTLVVAPSGTTLLKDGTRSQVNLWLLSCEVNSRWHFS